MKTPQSWVDLLESTVSNIIPNDWLRKKLELAHLQNRPLVVKLWFDPTAPDLHLWHAVVLKKLRQFQDMGHKIVVIIWDFTAQIWDPTWKNKSRPPLSKEKVAENAETYLNQLSKILDLSKLEVKFNSKWFDNMHLTDMIKLMSQHTLAQILERKDFHNRYNNWIPIALHELVYPLLQWHDSVVIESDVELWGNDQLLNCLVWAYMQEVKWKVAQIIMTMPLLVWTDWKEKMSKSLGNYIWLTEHPNEIFWKIMSIPDYALNDYINLATDFDDAEKEEILKALISGKNPMEVKKTVAYNVVKQYHSESQAIEAEAFFYKQVQDKALDSKEFIDIDFSSLNLPKENLALVDLCSSIIKDKSKSAIKKLIEAWAVSLDWAKITDIYNIVRDLDWLKLKIWKRWFYKIKL
ncbi:MAG: hypothetical protein ACD_3C00105G0009 [uncultured bacterium (gcode 4)]|uniref:Tyrosine--tRNA ligase n=1 Tax=uncultured bacterium (gcode 4) TaxID=1234023 RepID=K2FAA6_9BACT|nr:MAG: hypothetical protein ACD_3C00105G0009 [uncultured bacterium (gcode 4)]